MLYISDLWKCSNILQIERTKQRTNCDRKGDRRYPLVNAPHKYKIHKIKTVHV